MSEGFLAKLRDRIDWARYEHSAAKDAWDDESADKWQGYLDALLWVERELFEGGERMSQYGEPWELLGGIEPSIMASDNRRIVGGDGFDASLPDEELMRRIVLCVNNCAGLSDENLQTLLDNGHTLASVIVQMQNGPPIFAQVHSQGGQVVYDGNDAHPYQEFIFALMGAATAKWQGDHHRAQACQQEARRAKDGLGYEQLAVLKSVLKEVME